MLNTFIIQRIFFDNVLNEVKVIKTPTRSVAPCYHTKGCPPVCLFGIDMFSGAGHF